MSSKKSVIVSIQQTLTENRTLEHISSAITLLHISPTILCSTFLRLHSDVELVSVQMREFQRDCTVYRHLNFTAENKLMKMYNLADHSSHQWMEKYAVG